MKAKVTRTFTFDDEQKKKFMESKGYEGEDADYTEDDVEKELEYADASELEDYGDCDFINGYELEVTNEND